MAIMGKDFDILIKEKLSSTEAKPPKELWDKINAQYNNEVFDEAVKDKFESFQETPPEGIYSSAITKLAAIKRAAVFKYSSVAAIAAILISSLFINNKNDIGAFEFYGLENSVTKNKVDNKVNSNKQKTKHIITESKQEKTVSEKEITNTNLNTNQSTLTDVNSEKTNLPEYNEVKSEVAEAKNQAEIKVDDNKIIEKSPAFEFQRFNNPPKFLASLIQLPESKINMPVYNYDSYRRNVSFISDDKIKPNSDIRRNFRYINKYSVGFSYSPEVIAVDDYPMQNSLSLDLKYQNINFIVQSGLDLLYYRESADYVLDYNRYEYQKKQYIVTDAEINLDNNGNPVLSPTDGYWEDVYDTTNYIHNAKGVDHNLVLRIPILLGYQWNFKNFGLFMKGGASYNVLVHNHTANLYQIDEFSSTNAFIYPVKKIYDNNIEYIFSGGVEYNIKNNLSFSSEVTSRFYKKEVFKNINSDNNFALGLKLGLLYEI